MNEENNCCPLCNEVFTPADGVTAAEHLARNIIGVFAEMQKKAEPGDYSECPRCGRCQMSPKIAHNALSRHFDIHVCSVCGTDEAVRVFADCVLPPESWYIVKEILAFKKD